MTCKNAWCSGLLCKYYACVLSVFTFLPVFQTFDYWWFGDLTLAVTKATKFNKRCFSVWNPAPCLHWSGIRSGSCPHWILTDVQELLTLPIYINYNGQCWKMRDMKRLSIWENTILDLLRPADLWFLKTTTIVSQELLMRKFKICSSEWLVTMKEGIIFMNLCTT